MKQGKKYTVMGCLPEQKKYITLSRMRVDKLNRIWRHPKGWTGVWNPTANNHFLSPQEVEDIAKKHGCEMGPDCFYVPAGTIFYVPKAGFSNGIYLRSYAVDNPKMGSFSVTINATNTIPLEFGEI